MSFGVLHKLQRIACLAIVALGLAACSDAVSPPKIVTQPSLKQQPQRTPLAKTIVFQTDRPTQAILRVEDGGSHSFTLNFTETTTNHELLLLGLKPDRNYTVTVGARDNAGLNSRVSEPVFITTDPLPETFPNLTLLMSAPVRMEPGLTLLDIARMDRTAGFIAIVDNQGDVVWYHDDLTQSETQRLDNGNLLTLDSLNNLIREIDMLGNTIQAWHAALSRDAEGSSNPVSVRNFHHDVVRIPTDNTFLVAVQEDQIVSDFPIDETDPSQTATVEVRDDPIAEFAADGTVVNVWPFLDILKTNRISFDGTLGLAFNLPADWAHVNAVFYDQRDNSFIASLRHQDAVVKVSRDTGELVWILGPHENWEGFEQFLLSPIGSPFEWQFHQHASEITRGGNLLLFDNGNFKTQPFTGIEPIGPEANYSRAVEFEIDIQNMTVRQVWEYGSNIAQPLYAPFVGDADSLPQTDNVLITFGGLCHIDGIPSQTLSTCQVSARIIEVDRSEPANVVFDLFVEAKPPIGRGTRVYRSERIAGLYPDGILVE